MAQGTAIQALSRAAELLGDPSYLKVARRGIRAFSTRAPRRSARRRARRRQPLPDLLVLARPAGAERLRAEPERPLRLRDDRAARARDEPVREGRRRRCAPSCRATTPALGRSTRSAGLEATLEYHELATDFLGEAVREARPRPLLRRGRAVRGLRGRVAAARAPDLAARRGQPPVRALRPLEALDRADDDQPRRQTSCTPPSAAVALRHALVRVDAEPARRLRGDARRRVVQRHAGLDRAGRSRSARKS